MDGLNLVAKEAPVVNERAGVVALSVNAGAFEELGAWVVPVDPFDVSATADALEDALALGEDERRAWQQAIKAHVVEHDLEEWIAAQLADLDRASSIRRDERRSPSAHSRGGIMLSPSLLRSVGELPSPDAPIAHRRNHRR